MEGKRVLLDLFCGRWGWSRAFARRGWHCIGVDLTDCRQYVPDEIRCDFWQGDVLDFKTFAPAFYNFDEIFPDAIVASPPCEQFSVHGMKHFHPHPKYPANGIRLFEHTRALCEASERPYVIENVRAAQQFVGNAQHHCGPFYLWGNAVPPLLHCGIIKGYRMDRASCMLRLEKGARERIASEMATIPSELANTVAEYMERILEKQSARYSYDTEPKEK